MNSVSRACAIALMMAVFLHLLASTAAAQVRDTENDFLDMIQDIRQKGMPAICRDEVLERAVHCGCFGYRRFYTEYKRWSSVGRICRRVFKNRLRKRDVLSDCKRSGLLASIRTIDIGEMNDFFKNATRRCMVIPETSNSTAVKPEEKKPEEKKPEEKKLYSPEPEIEEIFATPEPELEGDTRPTKEQPEYNPVAPADETSVVMPDRWKTVHLQYKVVHRMLSRFCLIVMNRYRTDLTAARAYQKCCPRG